MSINQLKKYLMQIKYHAVFKGHVRILGSIPSVKRFKDSKLIIGNNVVLNSDFKNSNTALTHKCKFVLGYNGVVEVGENSQLNGVSITAYNHVYIGGNCQIASATFITDTDFHPVNPVEREKQVSGQIYNRDTVNTEPVHLGENVWIGWGAILLKGVTIGDNSIVAAGSVVVNSFPSNVIIAGNPAKIVKRI